MKNEIYNEILNFTTQDLPHIIGTAAALLLLLVLLVPVLFWLIPELFKLVFAFGIFIARKKKPISLMILGLIVIVLVAVAAFKFKPWEKMNASDTANITNSAPVSSVSSVSTVEDKSKGTPVMVEADACMTKAETEKTWAGDTCADVMTNLKKNKPAVDAISPTFLDTMRTRGNDTKIYKK